MALKGLSKRFEERMDEIYNRFSAKPDGGSGQPFQIIKPNDPSRLDTSDDTRFSPGTSFSRDRSRIFSFLKSEEGVTFLLRQAELQTGNVFSETRIYNPLFPFGKLFANGPRITRPLGTARGEGVGAAGTSLSTGSVIGSILKGVVQNTNPDSISQKSPGADSLVGGAGRLQKETSKLAVDRVLSRSGPTGLLTLLPPSKLTRALSAFRNVLETGILDINQRPELDVDGQYYSVALWAGLGRRQSEPSGLVKAGVSLRKGDIPGALINVGKGIIDGLTRRIVGTSGVPVPSSARNGRNDPARTDLNGLRYFIVNDRDADRYLADSVRNGVASIEYMSRRPYRLTGESLLLSDKFGTSSPVEEVRSSLPASILGSKLAGQIEKKKSLLSKLGGAISVASAALIGGSSRVGPIIRLGATDPTTGRLLNQELSNNPTSGNPGEQHLLFGELALANKYETSEGDVKYFREEIERQSEQWMESIRVLRTNPSYMMGYIGGLSPGNRIVDDFGIFSNKNVKVDGGRYIGDGAIFMDPIIDNRKSEDGSNPVNGEIKDIIRDSYKDTIDFIFHDYVNNRVVPFRAILGTITENIKTEFSNQKYVGRTEKNIVYAGAQRALSFTFRVQAFSKGEISFIWQKIQYLTGMAFPANYSDGFMVPPFIQLTLGKLYVDQPGYIESISYTMDEQTSWDIDREVQVPMGIDISIGFSVIEKTQVRTGSEFYGFGKPALLTTGPSPGFDLPSQSPRVLNV